MKQISLALLLLSYFAFAAGNNDNHEVDQAAHSFEEIADHFHETCHHDAHGTHLDTDAHELFETASWFHEEVHHGHDKWWLQFQFQKVRNIYNHTSETYHAGPHWTAHIHEDWRLVRQAYSRLQQALFWRNL